MVRLVRFSEGGEVRVGAQLGDGGDIADVTKVSTPPPAADGRYVWAFWVCVSDTDTHPPGHSPRNVALSLLPLRPGRPVHPKRHAGAADR
jgi:hypothetical protein